MRDLEARENWIQARIDELLDDDDFVESWEHQGSIISLRDYAGGIAEREHAANMVDLEDERINAAREY